MWRLGGVQVTGIVHHALNLPSLSFLWCQTISPCLVISHSAPTTSEVEANILACFQSISNILGCEHASVVHQVLMLDEVKVVEQPCFNDKFNKIVGLCCEHGKNTSLEYNSKKEVDLLLDTIEKGEVHLATEVCLHYLSVLIYKYLSFQATVGVLGVISRET